MKILSLILFFILCIQCKENVALSKRAALFLCQCMEQISLKRKIYIENLTLKSDSSILSKFTIQLKLLPEIETCIKQLESKFGMRECDSDAIYFYMKEECNQIYISEFKKGHEDRLRNNK